MVRKMQKSFFMYNKKLHNIIIAVVAVVLVAMMAFNVWLMNGMISGQIKEIAGMRMGNIAVGLQEMLTSASNAVSRSSAVLEEMIAEDAPETEIRQFLKEQKALEYELSERRCLNIFCVIDGETYISGMDTPDDYVLQDRSWYRGLLSMDTGEIYISPVYRDAFTDGLCFTFARKLPDGSSIIGMDYSVDVISSFIEEMKSGEYDDAIIVDGEGTIIGYTDISVVGKKLFEALPEYQGVFAKAVAAGGEDALVQETVGGMQSTFFCRQTENNWYMMLSIRNSQLYRASYVQLLRNFVVTVLLTGIIMLFYILGCRERAQAEKAYDDREKFLAGVIDRMRAPLDQILECSRFETLSKGEDLQENMDRIQKAGSTLSGMLANLYAYSGRRAADKPADAEVKKVQKQIQFTTKVQKRFQVGILLILIVTMVVTVFFSTSVLFNGSNMKMKEEVRGYSYEVGDWILEQKSILDMFTNVVIAKPELLDDYDGMVKFLDDITKHYPGISATYIANPDFKHGHPMVMNNGWVPEPDYKEEERVWYTGALEAEDFNITEPYYDARTGEYCVTFSKVVESDSGEFYGVFAIDFYLDVLTDILGAGYSGNGYAFLIDKDGLIINHPNPEYQFDEDKNVNVEDLVYKKPYHSSGMVVIKDYDGAYKACISMEENFSNFNIIVVKDAWSIFGDMVKYDILFLALFGACIAAVSILMYRMMQWQKEANDSLKKAAESARRAEQAKSNFLAQMSHEIRTPINAVLGMNEMILRENEVEDIQEYSENIQRAGVTLLTLINDILDFSKIEDGKMEIIPVEYDPSSLVNDLVNMIAERAKNKDLELKLEIDPTIPCMLYGDDVRIRQIITNLLTNAVKYTKQGSVLFRMKGERQADGETLRLHVDVVDTGIGIRKEDMGKLFSSFQRLDEEKNRNIEGTGLGISIVNSLLLMMGSELKVDSVYGKGSTFSFDIEQKIVRDEPIGDYNERRQQSMEEDRNRKFIYAPDAKVLIVDDNYMNIQVAVNLLKRNGVKPDTAASGRACLEQAEKNHYDIIFMDHMMPGMDGIETFRQLRARKLLPPETFVIIMTANAIVGAREEYLAEGFADYISKPIVIEELEDQMAKYLPPEKVSYREKEHKKRKEETAPEEAPLADDEEEEDSFTEEELRLISETAPELDLALGLSYCADSREFYLDMLSDYSSEPMDAELDGYIAAEDWENYHIQVHALKSTSKSIGATDLSEQARELEMAAKAGDAAYLKEHHAGCMEAYRDILGKVETLLGKLN